MFARQERPLPAPRLVPAPVKSSPGEPLKGISLGPECSWDLEQLPNAHLAIIGASGSGKTQTLKAIVFETLRVHPQTQVLIIDFHGDQSIQGELVYELHRTSPHGINPLLVDPDPQGGGPKLQSIQVAQILKQALTLGPNQEGLVLIAIQECYRLHGILEEDPRTWRNPPPDFSHLERLLMDWSEAQDHEHHKEASRLLLKLAKTFSYGVLSRPQPVLSAPLIRLALDKLPPEIQTIAAESLARQLLAQHRLLGEINSKIPRTFLVIDEARQMNKRGSAIDAILCDGRKFGLGLILASQSERHFSNDTLLNTATKIVLPVDQTEVSRVASRFRFSAEALSRLIPLDALVRLGSRAVSTKIVPYYERVIHGAMMIFFFVLLVLSSPVYAETAQVYRISDGDTLNITLAGSTERVRIRFGCIDAPEIKHGKKQAQPFGVASQNFLKSLVKPGDTVTVQIWDTDKYGRPVGLVFKEGQNLNLQMIQAGLAWSTTDRYPCPIADQIDLAEVQARSQSLGLWADPGSIDPDLWRDL